MSFATARLMEAWAHGQDVVDGLTAAPGPVQAGGAGRGAVGQEVELARDLCEQHPGHRQTGQGHGAEPPDHGGVDEQVERLGREYRQRRRGQGQDVARGEPGHAWGRRHT